MRISPQTILWLAAASAVGTVRGGSSITFENADFTGENGAAVFVSTENTGASQQLGLRKVFHWVSNQQVLEVANQVDLVVEGSTVVGRWTDSSTDVASGSPTTATTTSNQGILSSMMSAPTGNMGGGGGGALLGVGRRQDLSGPASGSGPAIPDLLTGKS
jgi:hypothetical protein